MALLSELRQDVRFTVRSLRKVPAFTVVVLLTLALGIGANTAIFSVVRGVLLEPLPFANSDQLVRIWHENRASGVTDDVRQATGREPGRFAQYVQVTAATGVWNAELAQAAN